MKNDSTVEKENTMEMKKGKDAGDGEKYLNELLEAMEAVRSDDLKVRVKKTGSGIYRELAASFNAMVVMIGGLATEVSRVAREVGAEGKLGSQANVSEASGA